MSSEILGKKKSFFLLFALSLIFSLFGVADAGAMCADVAIGAPPPLYGDQILDENGVAVEGIVDLTEASEKAPELISKHYEQEVVRVGIADYPIMCILRQGTNFVKRKSTKDHTIEINRYTTPPIQIQVETAYTESGVQQAPVDFGAANSVIGLHQTVIFTGIRGYKPDGVTLDDHFLQCRVVSRDSATGRPVLNAMNGKKVSGVITVPSLAIGTKALRGDRVGTETQIRTEQFGILPSPTDYFVSKKLIEFGTSGWYDNATKTIRWGSNEIKNAAMSEMLRTSAPQFWLGKQESKIYPEYKSNTPEMTYYSEGLFFQAGRELNLGGTVDISALVNLQKVAFGGNNSGNLKYFAMGDELSPLFNELILSTTGLNNTSYHHDTLNVDFTQIIFTGGKRIRFIDDPSLDDCGYNDKGFILDPRHAARYAYEHRILPLDGVKMQERDVSGMSITEESVTVLLNNDANVAVSL